MAQTKIVSATQNMTEDEKRLFWRKNFIYFYIFSILGHYVEVIWAPIQHYVTGLPKFVPQMPFIMPLALPYGFAILALIIFGLPIIREYKMKPVGVFFLSMFITGLVEYFSGIILIMLFGENQYWDYSGVPFNLHGQVCLKNIILFGFVSLAFYYLIYPFCEKLFAKLSQKQISRLFYFLLTIFVIDVIYSFRFLILG